MEVSKFLIGHRFIISREFVGSAREAVLTILEGLPESRNPRVLEGIVTIVLKSDDTNDLMRLSEKILAFVDHSQWGYEKIIQLVHRLSLMDRRFGGFSESVLLKVVEFQPDPQAEDKQARRRAKLSRLGDFT